MMDAAASLLDDYKQREQDLLDDARNQEMNGYSFIAFINVVLRLEQ